MNQEIQTKKTQSIFGQDSVIIQKWSGDIKGGRALDWSAVTEEVLYAGRIIITDGKGTYKPLAIESKLIADSRGSTKHDPLLSQRSPFDAKVTCIFTFTLRLYCGTLIFFITMRPFTKRIMPSASAAS